ncbi:MAG: glutathione S-transferase [Gammaproteobacteria bacterium]|jgi:glutathione S-transferase
MHLDLQLELRDVSLEANRRDELVAGGGRSTVPCLRVVQSDGEVSWLYESRDIIEWLKDEVAAISRRTAV